MLKVGIIGMGYGAQVHLPVYDNISGLNATCLADNGSGKADEIAKERGNLKSFSNGLELIEQGDADLISIATPPEFHFELVRQALLAGKHVFCEKPFCISYDQAYQLAELEKASKGSICIGFEFPYDGAFLEFEKCAQSGQLGRLQNLDVRWLTAGGLRAQKQENWKTSGQVGSGLLYDWCCHVIDYSAVILKDQIEWIFCEKKTSHRVDILCGFSQGTMGRFLVANDYLVNQGHRIELAAEKGTVTYQHLPPFASQNKHLEHFDREHAQVNTLPCLQEFDPLYADNRMSAMHMLIGRYLEKVTTGAPVDFPGVDRALYVWKVLEAAQLSLESGKKVCLSL